MELVQVFTAAATKQPHVAQNFSVLFIGGEAAVSVLLVIGCDQRIFGDFKEFTVVVTVGAGQFVGNGGIFGCH